MQWTWKGSVEDTNVTKTQCWLSRRLQPENTGVTRHIHERPVWGRGYVCVPPGTAPHSRCVMEETWAERTRWLQEGGCRVELPGSTGNTVEEWGGGQSGGRPSERWWVKVQLWGTKEPPGFCPGGANITLGRFKPGWGRGLRDRNPPHPASKHPFLSQNHEDLRGQLLPLQSTLPT